MRKRAIVSLGAAVYCVCNAAAQQSEESVLQATTRLVQVRVVAHEHNGKPVRDLTREDFILTDNGRPQPIRIFSMQMAEPMESPAGGTANPLVISNRTLPSAEKPLAVTVILLDALNIPRLDDFLYAKREVVRFLSSLHPGDPVALYCINGPKVQVIHDFTDDSASVVQSARRLLGSPIPHDAPALAAPHLTAKLGSWLKEKSREDEAAHLRTTTEWTLSALADVAHHLTGVPGRKSLLWISEAFPIAIGFDIQSFTQDHLRRSYQQLDSFSVRERSIGRLLNGAQVAVYPINPAGLVTESISGADINPQEAQATQESWTQSGHRITGGEEAEARIAAMIALANETGGVAFHNAKGVAASMHRAVEDASVSYVLGFYPPDEAWDGGYHEIGIHVKRSGVQVRGRRGYFASSADDELAPDRAGALRLAAASPLEGAAIGLRVNVESNPLTWYGQELVLVIDPRDVRFESVNDRMRAVVDVELVQQAGDGRTLGGVKDTLIYALLPASYDRALSDGLFFAEKLTVIPRASRVRVLVRDAKTGAVGSVSIRVRRAE